MLRKRHDGLEDTKEELCPLLFWGSFLSLTCCCCCFLYTFFPSKTTAKMKFESWMVTAAWLASTASAIGPPGPDTVKRLVGKAEKMANWKFPNPFSNPRHKKYDVTCEVEKVFPAREFVLDDLAVPEPNGLLQYRDALKTVFGMREYPGSWDGIDPHGYDRHILEMGYDELPLKVREWIEQQERTNGPGRGLYAVYPRAHPGTRAMNTVPVPEKVPVPAEYREKDDRRVVLFAPGAIYEVLPLWLAEGTPCDDALSSTDKYTGKIADGGVVGWPVHISRPKRAIGEREVEFRLKAQVLKLKEGETDDGEDIIVEETVEKTEKTKEKVAEPEKAAEAEKAVESEAAEETTKDEL
ncbi:Glucarate dehydratase [Podospora australis]|uniref:Glucarate dehydratase n=1 Tax=Podospora australis TaxID=1536484 RepID=A0AAN6WJU9_9PEZI|nr:Glucarate dehydratase [Podospora australis]